MKKITILFAFIITVSIFTSCDNTKAASKIDVTNLEVAKKRDAEINKGAATITFDKSEYDFGTVNEGEIVSTIYKVTNSGKTDLIITNAQATCGCTVPVWPREAIKPGETADIAVKFNTKGKPNRQSKSITLSTNTAVGKEVLKLSGMVIPTIKN
jgi:hypothetical protein|tara:strand:- start:266 stop:730 length:465 start_codon:yes stop_codon:yes gene_type:complete